MAYRVEVDRTRCCGSGLCTEAVPDVFEQDDDAVVVLLTPTPPGHQRLLIEDAAFACPAGAIRVVEEQPRP